MTQDDIKLMSDAELIRRADEAYEDMVEAASDQPNSAWHSACFAAFCLFGFEMSCRGLRRGLVH